jgi:threonine aldolase
VSAASDFRSDTVTRPSATMRAAMAAAEVGDDVLDGDPTVRRLEEAGAAWLGKRTALYVPSGTMANQIALGAWTRPGDEIVLERSAHIACWEAGAAAALHGLATLSIHEPSGVLRPAGLEAALRPDSIHCPRNTLVCVEQSFMGSGEAAGGRVLPLERLRELHAWARARGMRVHLDGARLANAAVAAGIPAARFASCADSVSLCLSKGLGAPGGSLIAGDDVDFLERARLVRKRLGGWMRQAGVLAAAGLIALQENVQRLEHDHALARGLARVLHGRCGLECPPAEVETNIVMARVRGGERDAAELARRFAQEGVLVAPMRADALRFVTHLDVGPADVARVEHALAACER